MSTPANNTTDRIVVMARGLGTRMRKADDSVKLDEKQAKIADSGVKALIQIDRPFLDYVLTVAADAGFKRVCMVIGPEHAELRDYYGKLSGGRVTIEFAIQQEPLGTANAVAAVELWARGEPFVVINSDNFYPAVALQSLRQLQAPGVALFDRHAMLTGSNIPADRIEKFAIAELRDRKLTRIIEKPSPGQLEKATFDGQGKLYLSMNTWLFDAKIFEACRAIPKSPRGEFEITDAVQYAIDVLKQSFAAALVSAPVLDLSSRADVAPVTARLRGMEVRL
jgi:dTDP-glucose pyrophosphorylase